MPASWRRGVWRRRSRGAAPRSDCAWRWSFYPPSVPWKLRSPSQCPVSNRNNRCRLLPFRPDLLLCAAPAVSEENQVTSTTSWDTEKESNKKGRSLSEGRGADWGKKLSHYIFPNFQDAQWSLESLESIQTDSSITWWDFCFRCSLLLGDVLMASRWEDQSVASSSDLLSLYPNKIVLNSKHEVFLIVRSKLFPTLRPSFCGL